MEQTTQRRQNYSMQIQDQAMKIASRMPTQQYFLTQQSRLLQEWGDKSLDLFRFTGEVLMSEYELKCENLTLEQGLQHDNIYSQSRKQFEAYCILNKKVENKTDKIYYFAKLFNRKNQKRNYFTAWKTITDKRKYIRNMQQVSYRYNIDRKMKACLKGWLAMTMTSNRIKIKNEVLHQTESEIASVQSQYQKLIRTLQSNLEKKLNQLQKEQQQHKVLHDKYEAMYTRSKPKSSVTN